MWVFSLPPALVVAFFIRISFLHISFFTLGMAPDNLTGARKLRSQEKTGDTGIPFLFPSACSSTAFFKRG
jgi:hypothetical protein